MTDPLTSPATRDEVVELLRLFYRDMEPCADFQYSDVGLRMARECAEKIAAVFAASETARKPVCWLKHGPYNLNEPSTVVFEDPQDNGCYSPLYFGPETTLSAIEEKCDICYQRLQLLCPKCNLGE